MFSPSKAVLSENGSAKIQQFLEALIRIKQNPNCSDIAKKTIDEIEQTFTKEVVKSPAKIAELGNLINEGSIGLILTDDNYREILNLLIKFIKDNPPDTLFNSVAIRATLAAVKSLWNNTIAHLEFVTRECDFLNKADTFAKYFKNDNADEKGDEQKSDYRFKIMENFTQTRNLLGPLVYEKNKDPNERKAKLKELIAVYKKEVAIFLKNDWASVNNLPYSFMRSIIPATLARDVQDNELWQGKRMMIFDCRGSIAMELAIMEDRISQLASKIDPSLPKFSPFQNYIQMILENNKEEYSRFKQVVDTTLQKLMAEATKYIERENHLYYKHTTDPDKIAIMKQLKEDLEPCFSKERDTDTARKIRIAFNSIMRAFIWHSVLLASRLHSDKKLSAGTVDTILQKAYTEIRGLYFSLNETNSGAFLIYQKPLEHKVEGSNPPAMDAEKIDNSLVVPILPYKAENPNIPPELDRFYVSFNLLCDVPRAPAANNRIV